MTRQYDSTTVKEIEELLKTTNDTETKAVLIVLLRVAAVLDDIFKNNDATAKRLADLDESLSDRVDKLSETKTFGKGFIKGFVTVWLVVQGFFGYAIISTYEKHSATVEAVHRLEEKVKNLEQQVLK